MASRLPGLADELAGATCVCGGHGSPFFSDTASDATERRWICDTCARIWTADGAQLDLLADLDAAPTMRPEV